MMKTFPAQRDKQNAADFRADSVDSHEADAVSFLIHSR
jgi:hypothetical protein